MLLANDGWPITILTLFLNLYNNALHRDFEQMCCWCYFSVFKSRWLIKRNLCALVSFIYNQIIFLILTNPTKVGGIWVKTPEVNLWNRYWLWMNLFHENGLWLKIVFVLFHFFSYETLPNCSVIICEAPRCLELFLFCFNFQSLDSP